MSKIGDLVRDARMARGLSQAQLARAVGISQAAINKIEQGLTLKSKHLPDIQQVLDIENLPQEVPVVGYVGAGGAAHYYASAQGPFDTVIGPRGSSIATVAVEIRGESLGPFFDRWLVFYDDYQFGVDPSILGRLCVVGLPDERVLVKQIVASKTRGLYHLLSQTEPPILDVQVLWAAPVKSMAPR